MHVQNITALFYKQIKDVLKNLPVLVLFLVYPCIAAVMTQAMKDQAGTGSMFISIFATMHFTFTPIVATSSVISEEKEMNTLRVLIMSNVTLKEYLSSIGGFIILATLFTGSSFLFINSDLTGSSLFHVSTLGIAILMIFGCLISVVVGACIGFFAKNASAANGFAVPFAMIFAFLPMLANFNKGIEAVSRFTYSQQLSYLFAGKAITAFGIVVMCINFIVLIVAASLLYRKNLSED